MGNQGGYDNVFMDKTEGKLQLVQLTTIASKHLFEIHHFSKLLTQLKEDMHITELQIYF